MRLLLIAVAGGALAAAFYANESSADRRRLAGSSFAECGPRTPSFYKVAKKWGTDKVMGLTKERLGEEAYPELIAKRCKVFGHFYHSIYDRWLPRADAPAFQFLEIGYFNGRGFDAYMEFLPNAEAHSLEVSCKPGFPWGNFAKVNARYQELRDAGRLHCTDANNIAELDEAWGKMNRPGAPPLKVVIDDGSHAAAHMVQSVFYWFPKLAPRGILVVEDIQPTSVANPFRSRFLPQMIRDVHYCGTTKDDAGAQAVHEVERFPTVRPLLAGVHCELHICVFERNDEPATPGLARELLKTPPWALDPRKHPGLQGRPGRGPHARGARR